MTKAFEYVGNELELFAKAKNWKVYWSSQIKKFIGSRVLDVGAGIGATAKILCDQNIERWLSIEPDKNLVKEIKRLREAGAISGKVEILAADLTTLEAAEKFDTILYIDVLEHIEDDRQELERAVNFLEPNGRIIMVGPAHNFLFTNFDSALGHFRRYDRALAQKATPNSLIIEQQFYLDSFGTLLSLGNKLILRSDSPTLSQIAFWDKFVVPVSRVIDPMTGYQFGKSMVVVWKKK